MSFPHDAAAPTAGGERKLLPDGIYELQITDAKEGKSKAGDIMVNVTCEVINNNEFNGAKVFYNVTFMPKEKPGAGMSTHFLKTIGQPWDGAIIVEPDNWVGEQFKAKIGTREYKNKMGNTVKTNDIKDIEEAGVPF